MFSTRSSVRHWCTRMCRPLIFDKPFLPLSQSPPLLSLLSIITVIVSRVGRRQREEGGLQARQAGRQAGGHSACNRTTAACAANGIQRQSEIDSVDVAPPPSPPPPHSLFSPSPATPSFSSKPPQPPTPFQSAAVLSYFARFVVFARVCVCV